MKNLRAYLWIGLALILLVNVQVWFADFGPRDAATAEALRQAEERERRDNPLSAEVPSVDAPNATAAAATPPAPADTPPAVAANGEVPTVAAPASADVPAVEAQS